MLTLTNDLGIMNCSVLKFGHLIYILYTQRDIWKWLAIVILSIVQFRRKIFELFSHLLMLHSIKSKGRSIAEPQLKYESNIGLEMVSNKSTIHFFCSLKCWKSIFIWKKTRDCWLFRMLIYSLIEPSLLNHEIGSIHSIKAHKNATTFVTFDSEKFYSSSI